MSPFRRKSSRREFAKDLAAGVGALAITSSLGAWNAAGAGKYESNFHKLIYKKGKGGPGAADAVVQMTGKDLNNRNTNFSFGYYSKPGAIRNEALVHPYDTCLAFVGLDPGKPNYLGAEIEIGLGKNSERYVFDVPTIVCVPKELPFGPIVARKVEKPYAHYEIGLEGEYKATKAPLPVKPAETREYEHLVKKVSAFAMGDVTRMTGPGNAFWIAWPRAKALEDFNVNFTWGFYNGLGNWHREGFDPHVHIGDEFLVFVGLDPAKPEYLGSDIDLYMGTEKEVHSFNTPTVAVCPSMFVHAPIITKKVDKTFAFFLIRTDRGEGGQRKTPEGYPIQ
jgi:hypothetical protein